MDVREALREALRTRGYVVASDTFASRGELYVRGQGDLASAVFEFKPTVQDAIDSMYQGAWLDGMPVRFAVLPTDAADDPLLELLEQMRILPIFFEYSEGGARFLGLDEALSAHVR